MYNPTIGIFGGTFDPIHFGHLRAALEIKETLNLSEMRIIPCKHPAHRIPPKAAPLHRLNMARLAIANTELILDEREMHRDGPSYSIDTLMSLRSEFPNASLSMIVGVDAFLSLPSWYQWEKLIQLANIVVVYRRGWTLPTSGVVVDLLNSRSLEPKQKITDFQSGRILSQAISALDISASNIRERIEKNLSPRFLVPEKVWQYIQEHSLYQHTDLLTSEKEVL